ncbi:MAG: hypothetical protein ACLFR1_15095, partial [Spirochaetia bacterium]
MKKIILIYFVFCIACFFLSSCDTTDSAVRNTAGDQQTTNETRQNPDTSESEPVERFQGLEEEARTLLSRNAIGEALGILFRIQAEYEEGSYSSSEISRVYSFAVDEADRITSLLRIEASADWLDQAGNLISVSTIPSGDEIPGPSLLVTMHEQGFRAAEYIGGVCFISPIND